MFPLMNVSKVPQHPNLSETIIVVIHLCAFYLLKLLSFFATSTYHILAIPGFLEYEN